MEEAKATLIDEVVVTGTGVQKKIAVTGAVTNVDIAELKTSPSTSMADALAGVVPGIQAMQSNGPVRGQFPEFWVRSISTFGASSSIGFSRWV